jgi:hypothetical protein
LKEGAQLTRRIRSLHDQAARRGAMLHCDAVMGPALSPRKHCGRSGGGSDPSSSTSGDGEAGSIASGGDGGGRGCGPHSQVLTVVEQAVEGGNSALRAPMTPLTPPRIITVSSGPGSR